MNKTVKRVWNIVTWVLVLCAAVLAVLMAGVRIVGLTPYAVLSGSMEPTYHVGSLIYVKHVEPETIKVGDPITFVLNEDLVVATHRVIGIDTENQTFQTKGDANESPDAGGVYFPNLIGKPIFTIPLLGFLSYWITNPPGMYIAITAGIVLIILVFLPEVLEKADAADKKKQNGKKPDDI
ncbi:signal peptidase I [Intestinibacillus massiliensis]|uniref:signal peptidase I n=1 Tax=Intestinibacillus massiliensis TaxID=1871029 RepID=UPI000B35DA02|nr:signal peptidase I [Intestinibacillus massiliensis]